MQYNSIYNKTIVTIISILALWFPGQVLAKDISNVIWEDVSPVSADRSNYIDNNQRLYSLGKNIYLARYENTIDANKKLTTTFSTLNKDNTWRYLLQHYMATGVSVEPIKYNHGLYFGFGYSIYRINHNNIINPMVTCSNHGKLGAYAYKKKLYVSCNKQFYVQDRGIGRLSLLRNYEDENSPFIFDFYPQSGVKYLGKYYFFGTDGTYGGELRSYALNSNRDNLSQNLHLPDVDHNVSHISSTVFNNKLYLFADDTVFGSTNGVDWGNGHLFPRTVKASYKTNTHMYALGSSPTRDHPINVYYMSELEGWNRALAQTHNFTDIVAIKGSYFYIVSKEDDEQYIVLRTSDGVSWAQVGDQAFTSIADIELTSNYLYVVTDESQVHRAKIK